MTAQQLEQDVWQLIDDNVMDMSLKDYIGFLHGLISDASTRAEAAQHDLQD